MNSRVYRILEFNKVKEKIKKFAKTSGGKLFIDKLAPYKSEYEIKRALEETNEAVNLIKAKGRAPFEGLYEVQEGIERAKKGGVLELGQLLKIGSMLRCSRNFKEYVKSNDEGLRAEKIQDIASILEPIKNLEEEIERAIVSEDTISDKASSNLFNIRRSLRDKNSSVRERVTSLVKSNSKHLQETLYTMRGDRYVLPVKSEHKGQVKGIVHDQSSTGATTFIEPIELVHLNNEIKELMLKERAEITKILTELSNKVALNYEVCKNNNKMLSLLDFIFAKGDYAIEIEGVMPKISDNCTFNLMSVRHPLIDKKEVVSSDIYMEEGVNIIMITGPNTGGKTVSLKTVGLVHLMALSGILIPAMEGSEIALYSEIFADIGDEQSIEQSLSTFSGHMTNIIKILEHAKKDALVLFDELGAGTDPTEGAALAVSIVEELRNRGSKVILTTHYSELKAYAIKTEDVENASVEFNIKTLRPTYRLLIGVPGKSNAFEISRRLGLDDNVIERAKEFVSEENMEFESLIEDLQEKSILASNDAREAISKKLEAIKLKNKYEEKIEKFSSLRDKELDKAKEKARDIVKKAKEEADEILKAMRELEKMGISNGGRNRLEEERRKLKESLEEKEKKLVKEREVSGKEIKNISLGMDAFLPSLNQNVIVVSLPDNRGDVLVEAGIMKISVKAKDLRMIEGAKKNKKEKKERKLKLNMSTVESRLDLRGLDAEEACYRTDKYLDDAYRGNLGEVTIVHGKGTGVLRKAINDMLKRHPHVKSHRLGVYGEGGDGVTVVVLK